MSKKKKQAVSLEALSFRVVYLFESPESDISKLKNSDQSFVIKGHCHLTKYVLARTQEFMTKFHTNKIMKVLYFLSKRSKLHVTVTIIMLSGHYSTPYFTIFVTELVILISKLCRL